MSGSKKRHTAEETIDVTLFVEESPVKLPGPELSSSDEDSLYQAEGDSDYQIPESDTDTDDEEYEPVPPKKPMRRVSALPPRSLRYPESDEDVFKHSASTSASARSPRPSPSTPRPQSRRSTPHKTPPKKRVRGGSAASQEEEEGERWHGAHVRDTKPDPLRFTPARVPGPTFDTTASWPPLTLFQLFFSRSVIRTIIDNTNENAQKRLQAGMKFVWNPLTVKDFYIFLSIILFSGIVKVPGRSDLWRREWPYNFRFPRESMTRARFEAILWSLHLSNPREDAENELKRNTAEHDRLFKIKPLYTDIVAACQSHFQPYQNISIDERMVASKARIFMKQYMKNKPIKWGYKLFVLADSSTAYTWNFFVYTGKSEFTTGQGLSYTSVMDLLPLPLLGGGYTLFSDNFYSSPALFEDLSKKNIGCCGTIRKHVTGFPRTEVNDLSKKAARGDMRWIRNGKLLFVKWMDTREVTMCSTVHEAFSGQTVQRNMKEAGVWDTKTIPVPDAIVDYNKSMGGVDLSDALIGYYTVHHKTRKWYKTFFYHFVDIAVVNSFILHKEVFKRKSDPAVKKPYTQKTFRETLAKQLLEFGVASEEAPPAPRLTCMPMYLGEDATDSRKYCKMCQNSGRKRIKTPVYCRKCQVPLCFISKRNCFAEWHDAH